MARPITIYKQINPKQDIKGGDIQDIHHWVVEIKNSVPYLRISTDDDIYYVELSNLNKIKSDLNLTDND